MFSVSAPFCWIVTVALVPLGASFTDVTSKVNARAVASRSEPPLATPPSSCTWKVKRA